MNLMATVRESADDESFMKTLPRTESDLNKGLERVLTMLCTHDEATIARNRRALEWIFEKTFENISSEGVKTRAAGFVASLDIGARAMNDYLRFLWDFGLAKQNREVFMCYITLFDACIRLAGRSLHLCKQFTEIGLVQISLIALRRSRTTYKKSRV